MKNTFLIALPALTLIGCASPETISPQGLQDEIAYEQRAQREMVVERGMKERARVYGIAYPILLENAELCERKIYSIGATLWSERELDFDLREAAHAKYGLSETVQIEQVLPSSPAEKAGLKSGDKIITVNGKKVTSGFKGIKDATKFIHESEGNIVNLSINRAGHAMEVPVTKALLCGYGIHYAEYDHNINAYADGNTIFMTRGMYRFAESDDELALVIAHELAHNTMLHNQKGQHNETLAGIGGFMVDLIFATSGVDTQGTFMDVARQHGGMAYSVGFEQEADYVGMYYLARAGIDTDNVAYFWRRMSAEIDSSSIDDGWSHPANAERFIAIGKAHAEISQKRAQGLELLPNLDEDSRFILKKEMKPIERDKKEDKTEGKPEPEDEEGVYLPQSLSAPLKAAPELQWKELD